MEEEIKIVSSVKKEDWSKFVLENSYGNVFQTPEMKDVYSRTKRIQPLNLFALDGSNNILSSVLAYISTEKGGVFKHVSTRAVIPGGPLFASGDAGIRSLPVLMREYDRLASKKAIFTEIRMEYNIPEISMLKDAGYEYDDHLNFLLDLDRPEEDVWNDIHNPKRRGIKKAQKSNIDVEEVKNKESVGVAYTLLRETYKRARIPLADVSLFEAAFDVLGPLNQFKVFLFRHENKPIATRILLTFRDRVYDWYNGSTEESFNLCANDLSEWHAIRWSIQNRYKTFDFCGAGKPNKEYGPREFKRRFGGRLVNFGRYMKVYHPIKFCVAKMGYRVYQGVES